MRKRKHKENDFRRGRRNFSKDEIEELNVIKQRLREAEQNESRSLREHLQTFNDGVLAIIITIIVLEIQPALHEVHYDRFLVSISIFLITFFIIADFWYDLHLIYAYYILKPRKATAIVDFIFLADLALLPVMTKWIMEEPSTFAVANYGVVFLIAKIFEYLIQYVGTKQTLNGDSKIMEIFISRSFVRRVIVTLLSNVILISLSFYSPRIAMILYLVVPILSFVYPIRPSRIR